MPCCDRKPHKLKNTIMQNYMRSFAWLLCKGKRKWKKGGLTIEQIKGGDGIGSTNWGNYSNSSIILTKGKYNSDPETIVQWLDVVQGQKDGKMLLTTGASEDTSKMNIYDFAGNVWEWTLEYSSNNDAPCVRRGGCYDVTGSEYVASNHRVNDTISCIYTIGFRAVLY